MNTKWGIGPNRSRRVARRSRAGFTVLEVTIAAAILTLSVGAVTSMLATTNSLTRANAERSAALNAIHSTIERMRATEPSEVFARFNADPLDDIDLDDPGFQFDVEGLTPQRTDADGFVGEIEFPGDGVLLIEDFEDVELGMSRDLNGDGVIDGVDHGDDYSILPVRVRAEWLGASGNQQVEVVFVVSSR